MAHTVMISLPGDWGTRDMEPRCEDMFELSRRYGGLGPLDDALTRLDVNAWADVIRVGIGEPASALDGLKRAVYEMGFVDELFDPVGEYLAMLRNGGRPVDEPGSEVT